MRILVLIVCFFCFPVLTWAQSVGVTKFVSASPTADTNAYATGELIGGKLTFSPAVRSQTGTGYVVSVKVVDLSAQAADLELVIFSENPAATTFTDQAAFDIADADVSKVVAVVALGSASRFAYADNGVKYVGSLLIPVQARSGDTFTKTLYGALLSRGTPTFAGASDLTVTLGISQD